MLSRAHSRLLSRPGFRRLWIATSISELGSNVGRMAFILLVYELAREAGVEPERDVALVMLLETLPMLLLGPVAGAVVDRVDRKKLLVACDLAAGLLLLAIPWLASLPTRAPLFAAAMVFSSISTVFHPARQSAIPDLVEREELADANGLSVFTGSLNLLLGTALGGVLIGVVGKTGCFLVDSLTFGISVVFLLPLVLPRHMGEGARRARDLLGEVGRGLRFLLGHRILVYTTGTFFLTYCFVGVWYPLLPSFVEERLGGEPDVWVPLTLGSFAVGGGVGGILAPRLARKLGSGRAMLVSLITLAFSLPLYALNDGPLVSLALSAGGGAFLFSVMVMDTTIVHEEAPPAMRGRIFGARAPLQAAGLLIGTSLVLGASEAQEPGLVLLWAAIAYGVLLLAGTALHPGARLMARRPAPSREPREP